jgi:glutathione S-transferase
MLTLYGSGAHFGLPDASPFVMKVETLLRMAQIPYARAAMRFSQAPKGKIPYIEDDGLLLGDSTFIRAHLERKYGVDFDAGLGPEERAVAWAFEKMAEDNLYWAIVHLRWMDDENFRKGPIGFFRAAPAPLRPMIVSLVRRRVRSSLKGHGMGRHSPAEIAELGVRSVAAIADFLGDKPFFMGDRPTGADATMFAFVAGALSPAFEAPLRSAAESRDKLRAYVGRMTRRFYPECGEIAGCPAAA